MRRAAAPCGVAWRGVGQVGTRTPGHRARWLPSHLYPSISVFLHSATRGNRIAYRPRWATAWLGKGSAALPNPLKRDELFVANYALFAGVLGRLFKLFGLGAVWLLFIFLSDLADPYDRNYSHVMPVHPP